VAQHSAHKLHDISPQQGCIICRAPAKLNLFLHITGRRPDGYHLLQTVFQFIDLADTLSFQATDDGSVSVSSTRPGVAECDNMAYRAARSLQHITATTSGVVIHIDKQLPMGAGLGGGSSDAATTLVALNQLWDLQLTQVELMRIGGQLGADVPVFVYGRACWAEGTGDIVTAIDLPEPWYLVLRPQVEVSTAEMFAATELTRHCTPLTIRDFLSGQSDNVFERVVARRFPEVARTLLWLRGKAADIAAEMAADLAADLAAETGAEMAADFAGDQGSSQPAVAGAQVALSGTGSCVFMRCASKDQALNLLQQRPADMDGFVARGCNLSPLYA